jgi:glycosyltransferase involved in cell wall biosynthesis
MRVLQIIDSLALGGAEVLLKDMAPLFRSRQVSCEVAVLRRTSGSLEHSLEVAGVTLHATDVAGLYSLRQISALSKLMRKYDIVHIHLFPAQLWAALAAASLESRIPIVTTEHNTWNGRRRWWLRSFDAWMYNKYARIACNSEATAAELICWCPGTAPKVQVIHNGVSIKEFEKALPSELPDIPHDRPLLIFVGRFEPQKDHATILRALSAVPEAYLLLVGDGPLRPQIENLAKSLGIAQRVFFLGWRSDVPGILKASDIYIHSTTSDGFGIAACEAMAAGLPVLASDVAGLAQVVEGAGVLFPVGDDKALAREIATLIASPERQRHMSEASRRRASRFTIERTVDGYIEMYRSVLETWPK